MSNTHTSLSGLFSWFFNANHTSEDANQAEEVCIFKDIICFCKLFLNFFLVVLAQTLLDESMAQSYINGIVHYCAHAVMQIYAIVPISIQVSILIALIFVYLPQIVQRLVPLGARVQGYARRYFSKDYRDSANRNSPIHPTPTSAFSQPAPAVDEVEVVEKLEPLLLQTFTTSIKLLLLPSSPLQTADSLMPQTSAISTSSDNTSGRFAGDRLKQRSLAAVANQLENFIRSLPVEKKPPLLQGIEQSAESSLIKAAVERAYDEVMSKQKRQSQGKRTEINVHTDLLTKNKSIAHNRARQTPTPTYFLEIDTAASVESDANELLHPLASSAAPSPRIPRTDSSDVLKMWTHDLSNPANSPSPMGVWDRKSPIERASPAGFINSLGSTSPRRTKHPHTPSKLLSVHSS